MPLSQKVTSLTTRQNSRTLWLTWGRRLTARLERWTIPDNSRTGCVCYQYPGSQSERCRAAYGRDTKSPRALLAHGGAHDFDPRRFRYGSKVLIGEDTDFLLVLSALADGVLYLDPAVKAEEFGSSAPMTKRRNQFRLKRSDLPRLYKSSEVVEL